MVEGRILEIEDILRRATHHRRSGLIRHRPRGARQPRRRRSGRSERRYQIVGAPEADPTNGKISNESPVGAALLGKAVGETVDVHVQRRRSRSRSSRSTDAARPVRHGPPWPPRVGRYPRRSARWMNYGTTCREAGGAPRAGIDPYPPRATRTHTAARSRLVEPLPEASDRSRGHPSNRRSRRRAARHGQGDLPRPPRRQRPHPGAPAAQNMALDIRRPRCLDLGDFIGVPARLCARAPASPRSSAHDWTMLAKALRPPPEKWHGLDRRRDPLPPALPRPDRPTTRRAQVFAIAQPRSSRAIRRFLDDRGFLEVETPVLQREAGGAAARPFTPTTTRSTRTCFLRIALELHLKRLIVGGFDRVYEIGRVFRNEGVDRSTTPSSRCSRRTRPTPTTTTSMRMVEEMVVDVAREVARHDRRCTFGEADDRPRRRRGARCTIARGAHRARGGLDLDDVRDARSLLRELRRRDVATAAPAGCGKLVDEAMSASYVEPNLSSRRSCSTTRASSRRSPSASRDDPRSSSGSSLVGGFELGNAYSELNDPIDQRAALRRAARSSAARRRRGRAARRGLPRRARARHAADGRPRHRHRPPRHDPHRADVDPRGDPVPAAQDAEGLRPPRAHRHPSHRDCTPHERHFTATAYIFDGGRTLLLWHQSCACGFPPAGIANRTKTPYRRPAARPTRRAASPSTVVPPPDLLTLTEPGPLCFQPPAVILVEPISRADGPAVPPAHRLTSTTRGRFPPTWTSPRPSRRSSTAG